MLVVTGTLDNPIVVKSYGDEQYIGCTGCPADTHVVIWLTTSRDRPQERCPECGSVYEMEYVGPAESHDAHGHHGEHDHREFKSAHSVRPTRSTDTRQMRIRTERTTTRESQRPWLISFAQNTDEHLWHQRRNVNVYNQEPLYR